MALMKEFRLNRVKREKAVAEQAPDVKECAYCYTRIPAKATRCPNCTSDLGNGVAHEGAG